MAAPRNTPKTTPPAAPPKATAQEEADIMGEAPAEAAPRRAPWISAPVQYWKGTEPWAAIVTKVGPDEKVHLYVLRPDGVHQCFIDVPRRGGYVQLGCWEFAPEMG